MTLPIISFSSDVIEQASRFDAYNSLYAVGSDVVRTDGLFFASVKAYRFDRMLVFERHLSGVSHSRDSARVRRDGFDHATLHLLLSGELIAGPPGAERRMEPGEIVVFDSSVPHRGWNHDSHTISVSLARDQVGSMISDIRPFHGTILTRRAAGVIADMLLSFTRRYETLSAETSGQFGSMIGILLAAALQGVSTLARSIPQLIGQSDRGRRQRAERYIEAHLGDQDLDADSIATGLGLSRSVLYRCFAEDGGVVRFIQQQRLNRIRNVLRRRSDGAKLASIAHTYGFSNEQHLNRAFRSAFGRPPGQFRRMMEQLRRTRSPGEGRTETLPNWLVELY